MTTSPPDSLLRDMGPCEVCHSPGPHLPFEGHYLCSMCSLIGCGRCWKARMVHKDTLLWWRWVCPSCGYKGKRQWWHRQ